MISQLIRVGGFVFFLVFIISSFFFSCTHLKISKSKETVFKMNEYSNYSPFPNKNFVFLQKYTTLNESGEPCIDIKLGCPTTGDLISSASGAIIKKHKDTAYILTAAHFCENEGEEKYVPLVNDQEVVRAFSGILQQYKFPVSIIRYDSVNDLCLMKIKDPAIERMNLKRLKISRDLPEIGEKVYTVAAPMGVFTPNVRHHFTGYFSGCDDYFDYGISFCFYTIPASEGSSGSLVLNKKGEIVGMIQMSLEGFNNLSIGVESYKMYSFLKETGSEINILF